MDKTALRGSTAAARWLRRTVVVEIALAVLIILTVGLLTALEPARQFASRTLASEQQALTFTDAVEDANIALTVEPARIGANTFTVKLVDRFGEPIDNASDVRLRVSYLDADFGEEPVPTTNIGGGEYELADSAISIAARTRLSFSYSAPTHSTPAPHSALK